MQADVAQVIKEAIDKVAGPVPYSLGLAGLLALALRFRRLATRPLVFGIACLAGTAFFVFAFPDPNFHKIVTKGDNVPIVFMLVSVIFFTWLALRRGVIHDEPVKRGQ